MKLVTKELLEQTPRIGATDAVEDPTVQFKLFTPTSSWTWYIIEVDAEGVEAFGYAHNAAYPDGAELGYINLDELRALTDVLPMQLPVERDLHWSARPLSEVTN